MPNFDQIMSLLVLLAGFMNAGMIAMQGLHLAKVKDSTGVLVKMFCSFVVFQAVFAINGWRLGDPWQMWGMIASIIVTVWVMYLAIRYRKPNRDPNS